MPGFKHPLHNQTFELLEDGNVRVEDLDTNQFGIFRPNDCTCVAGELRFADWHYLRWVGGRKVKAGLF